MTRTQGSSSSITITKKRKSTGDIDEGRAKAPKQPRRTLETFFSPQVPASSTPDEVTGKIEHVSLNDEQIRVLKMVVQEEKNVFFTGSAGALAVPQGAYMGVCVHIIHDMSDEPSEIDLTCYAQERESHYFFGQSSLLSRRSTRRNRRSSRSRPALAWQPQTLAVSSYMLLYLHVDEHILKV